MLAYIPYMDPIWDILTGFLPSYMGGRASDGGYYSQLELIVIN